MEKIIIILLIFLFILCSIPPIKKFYYWKKHRKLMINSETIFNILYSKVNAIEISLKDRSELKNDHFGLIYGEIVFESFAYLLSVVNPKPGEIFYDLGSGAGKAVFCSALLYDWKKCCGIELLNGLHQLSLKLLKKFNKLPQVKKFFPLKKYSIEFIHSNLLDYNINDADVIFINATSFTQEFWEAITQKLIHLKIGTRIILTTKKLNPNFFQLIDAQMLLMSWGFNSVNIYQKIS